MFKFKLVVQNRRLCCSNE